MKNHQEEKRSSKQKPVRDLGTYIVIGFAIGALVGIVTDNLVLWMSTGMCLGIVIGAISGMRAPRNQE